MMTVAVLGARDSAAPAVAESLLAAAGPGGGGGAGVRVVVGATPEDRPDAAVLVVDAVCPVRPDDVEIARGVASRLPMAVVLAGRADTCTAAALAATLDVTSRRLADAGVHAPVHLLAGDDPATPRAVLSALTAAVRDPRPAPGPASGATAGVTAGPGQATVDWLLARRTEAITSRSQALRQDMQAVRADVVQDLHRSVRDLGGWARDELSAASRPRVDHLVRELAARADAAVADTLARADDKAAGLISRHLGVIAPTGPAMPTPTSGIEPGRPPRHRGEEALVMAMGAAGGTGVGRMLLSPLSEVPGLAAAILPLALLCGLLLGWTTVTVRRTQALRTHAVATATDRLAALRADAELALGARLLSAESAVTDGFAHDPGPRVADLERRIRTLRAGETPPGAPVVRTVAAPADAAPPAPATTGSVSP